MHLVVDAILFDIDGTLVDSTRAVERTWRHWAAQRGIDAELILRGSHGRRTKDTVARFVPAGEVAEAVAGIEAHELAEVEDVTPLPGAATLLAALPGDRWAAVTSGPRRLMTARLAAAGLPVPEVLICADDVRHGKPDPEGYLAAARLLGADPARCLVVEDAPAGIEAGRRAGAHVLGVATSHPADALVAADEVVDDLGALEVAVVPDGLRITVPERR